MIIHLFNSSSVSGPERLVLPALASAREHFTVINLPEKRFQHRAESDPLGDYAKQLQLDYYGVPVGRFWDYDAIGELRNLFHQLKPDLVHAHDVKASAYLLEARRGLKHRFPIVSTHHGVKGRPSFKTRTYEWVYRTYFLKPFDRVFSVSSADTQLLKRSHSSDRLRLHLNGIDATRVEPQERPEESRRIRALWLPDEPQRDRLFLMGVIGRLSEEKDHARTLRVLAELNRLPCERDWRCLVFGTGPLEKPLQEQARRLGLEQRIEWMGYRNNVGNELAGMDLVLSMSKAEGLPISLVEAGCAGTPVMCTQVGGISDLIPDESYGHWISPREADLETARRLQTCLSPEGQNRVRHQALRYQRRVLSEFTQARWIERLKELYGELDVHLPTSAPSDPV